MTTVEYQQSAPIVGGLRAWAPLGGGRRCETWLAWSPERWCPVVVKLPRAGLAADADTRTDLAREAAMVGGLAHPGVQRLYAAELAGEVPYLVFEYVEGPTLDSSIAAEGPLPADEAVLLGLQVAAVLRYLHGSGVVHLDLKPSNVCLRDGRPVLIDFGIARAPGLTRCPGAPKGSPPYMAPEQCRDEPATPSTDLFALGALLYEAVTGEHAFHPRRDAGGWSYPQLSAPVATTPGPLGSLIGWLLEPDPGRRPADAATVLRALAGALPAGTEGAWPDWVDLSNVG
jgi:serine/threonine protein kinase